MRTGFLLLVLALCSGQKINAQLSFMRLYGTGEVHSVQQASDSGYIVSGFSSSGNMDRVFLMKTTPSGEPEWMRVFQDANPMYTDVVATPSGYVLAYALLTGTQLVFTDFSGQSVHTLQLDGWVRALQLTSNGNIVGTGTYSYTSSTYGVLAFRCDGQANMIWAKYFNTLSPYESDAGESIIEVENGNLLIAGRHTGLNGQSSGMMLKLSPGGAELYRRSIHNSAATVYNDKYHGAAYLDNQYVFCGVGRSSTNAPFQMLLTVTDTLLNVTGNYLKGATSSLNGFRQALTTAAGDVALLALPGSSSQSRTGIVLLDDSMNVQWERLYDTADSTHFGSYAFCMTETHDSGFVIGGYCRWLASSNSYIMLIKTAGDGHLACGDSATFFPSTIHTPIVYPASVPGSTLNHTQVSNQTMTTFVVSDTILCLNNPQGVGMPEDSAWNAFSIYPVPVRTELLLSGNLPAETEYCIYNTSGAIVMEGRIPQNAPIDVSTLSSGLYILHLSLGESRKFIKQ